MVSGLKRSVIFMPMKRFQSNSSIYFKYLKLNSLAFGSEIPLSIQGTLDNSGCTGTLIELAHLSLNADTSCPFSLLLAGL